MTSPFHAGMRVVRRDAEYGARFRSLNGTYVNSSGLRQVLRHGDEVQIGKFRLVFLSERMAEVDATTLDRRGIGAAC